MHVKVKNMVFQMSKSDWLFYFKKKIRIPVIYEERKASYVALRKHSTTKHIPDIFYNI